MKKFISLLLTIILIFTLSACKNKKPATSEPTEPVTETTTESEATTQQNTAYDKTTWYELQDGVLIVFLEANATTGYTWSYAIDNEKVLECQGAKYLENDHPEGMVGVGGLYKATFAGVENGKAKVSFSYARSWEEEAPCRTCDITVQVENGRIVEITNYTDITVKTIEAY